jgi:hypothetical protein
MPPLLFADNFLAGSILSLLLPVGLLIAIAIWYTLSVKRVPKDTPTSSTAFPAPEVGAAPRPSETGITPAEPPPGEP